MAVNSAFQKKCKLIFNPLVFAISIVIVPIHRSPSHLRHSIVVQFTLANQSFLPAKDHL
jgi:hypothetical protein